MGVEAHVGFPSRTHHTHRVEPLAPSLPQSRWARRLPPNPASAWRMVGTEYRGSPDPDPVRAKWGLERRSA